MKEKCGSIKVAVARKKFWGKYFDTTDNYVRGS
jgi:hypothetical protein